MWDIIENILVFIGAIFLILSCISVVYIFVQIFYWNVIDHSGRDSYWKF